MTTLTRITHCVLVLLLGVAIVPGQSKSIENVPTVTFCDLSKHPEIYSNKRIRVRAVYRVGFEWQEIYSLRCPDAPSTWLEFSNNIDEGPSRTQLKKMDLGNRFSISVGVVLEGRLTGYGGGYGHMNGYALAFTADCIESAKRLDTHGFHRRALLPEDRKRIEAFESGPDRRPTKPCS